MDMDTGHTEIKQKKYDVKTDKIQMYTNSTQPILHNKFIVSSFGRKTVHREVGCAMVGVLKCFDNILIGHTSELLIKSLALGHYEVQ